MGLDLRWIGPDGSSLDELFDPQEYLDRAIVHSGLACPLIDSIDRYADTDVSPSRQLTAEIRQLRNTQTDPEISLHLGRLLAIAEAAEDYVGSYLHFIGD